MDKYIFGLILSSILAYVGSFLFTYFRFGFLLISFMCCICLMGLLWNKDKFYHYPFLVLFIFKFLLSERYSEGILLFIIMGTFLVVLSKIKDIFFIDDVSYKRKLNNLDVLCIVFLIVSLCLPSLYYSGLLFFIFFINSLLVFDFFLYINWWKLRNNNIYVLNGNRFLDLTKMKTIIFNKTGVLTLGELEIKEVISDDEKAFWKYLSYAEVTRDDRIANLIRKNSNYKKVDLSKRKRYQEFNNGVVYYLDRKKVIVGNSNLLKEHGIEIIEKDIGTFIYVALNKKVIGYLEVVDKINLGNKKVISDLKKLGNYYMVVFSNDQKQLVKLVSKTLGIYDSYGELTPQSRDFWLYYLKMQHGDSVLLVSDDDIDLDVSVRINLIAFPLNDYGKSDIIVLGNDLGKVNLLLKSSQYLEKLRIKLFLTSIFGKFLIVLISLLWISDLLLVVNLIIIFSILEILARIKRI